VREEDLDWTIYHRIPETGCITVEDLATATGLGEGVITRSLERLEHALLVRRSGAEVHLLSIQESLIECQCRHTTEDLPFVIENGVVRAKKRDA
jgi:DNA-binding MarR family transcriptional regulator